MKIFLLLGLALAPHLLPTSLGAQTAPAIQLCESFELTFETGAADGRTALDSEGDLFVVGLETEGTATIYRRCGGTLLVEQVIVGSAADGFGRSVSILGEWLFIGSYLTAPGTVSVYRNTGNVWSLTQTLTASNGVGSDSYGSSVDSDGDTLIVGAPSANGFLGLCYAYVEQAGVWSEQAIIIAPCIYPMGLFGLDVSIRGDVMAAGSPTEGLVGAVRVFQRTGVVWNFVFFDQPAPLGAGFSDFAVEVQLADEKNLFVSSATGKVYVYEDSGSGWSNTQILLDPSASASSDYSNSIDANSDGSMVAVGAPGKVLTTIEGSAFTYVYNGTAWALDGYFIDDDPESRDELGSEVGLEGDTLIMISGNQGSTDTPKIWASSVSNTRCSRLSTSLSSISLSAGASGTLDLDLDSTQAGNFYHLLGSLGGSSPPVYLGSACVPLTLDTYFLLTIMPNVPPLSGNSGILDINGQASVGLVVPPLSDPSLSGLVLQHAAISYSLGPLTFMEVTNPVAITLVP